VASAKSSMHDPTDETGSDTWRHRHAGAGLTVFLGPKEVQVNCRRERSLEDTLMGFTFDFLIVEGMKTSRIPKVWCIGDADYPVSKLPPSTEAIVAWESVDVSPPPRIPLLHTTDSHQILDLVIERAAELHTLRGI
jgi:molybdopterin-guanine dinucleotide biosynthesis protein MobB